MKIKKIKKAMEHDIADFISARIAQLYKETEIDVKAINIMFGSSHDADGEVKFHLQSVKTKLDV